MCKSFVRHGHYENKPDYDNVDYPNHKYITIKKNIFSLRSDNQITNQDKLYRRNQVETLTSDS